MAVIKEDLWNQVLEKLALQLSAPTFETWIKPTKVQALSTKQLVLLTDNPFARNWLQKHYLTQISTIASELLGHEISVTVTVKDRDDTEKTAESISSDRLYTYRCRHR